MSPSPSDATKAALGADPVDSGGAQLHGTSTESRLVQSSDYNPAVYLPYTSTSGVPLPEHADTTQTQTAMRLGGSPPLVPMGRASGKRAVRYPHHRQARLGSHVSNYDEPDEYDGYQPTPAELEAFEKTDRTQGSASHVLSSYQHPLADSDTPLTALLLRSEEGRGPLAASSSSYALRPVSPFGSTPFSLPAARSPSRMSSPGPEFAPLEPPSQSSFHPTSMHTGIHIPHSRSLDATLSREDVPQDGILARMQSSSEDPVVSGPVAADLAIEHPTFPPCAPPFPLDNQSAATPPTTSKDSQIVPDHASDVDGVFEPESEEHDELEEDGDREPEPEDAPVDQTPAQRRVTGQVRDSVIAALAEVEPIVQKIADNENVHLHQIWDVALSHWGPKSQSRDPTNPWNLYRTYYLGNTNQELRRIYPEKSDEELDRIEPSAAVQSRCYEQFKKDYPQDWRNVLDIHHQIIALNTDVTVHKRRKLFQRHVDNLTRLTTLGHKLYNFETAFISVGNNINQDQQLGKVHESEGILGLLKRVMRAATDDEVVGHSKSHAAYLLSENIVQLNHSADSSEPTVDVYSLADSPLSEFIKQTIFTAVQNLGVEIAPKILTANRWHWQDMPKLLAHTWGVRIRNYPWGMPFLGAKKWTEDKRKMDKGIAILSLGERRVLATALLAKDEENSVIFERIPHSTTDPILVIESAAPPPDSLHKRGLRVFIDKNNTVYTDYKGVRRTGEESNDDSVEKNSVAVRRSTRTSAKRSANVLDADVDDEHSPPSSPLPTLSPPPPPPPPPPAKKPRKNPAPVHTSAHLPSSSRRSPSPGPSKHSRPPQAKKPRRISPTPSVVSSHSSDCSVLEIPRPMVPAQKARTKAKRKGKGKAKAISEADIILTSTDEDSRPCVVQVPQSRHPLINAIKTSTGTTTQPRPRPKPIPKRKESSQRTCPPLADHDSTSTAQSGASIGGGTDKEVDERGRELYPTTPTPTAKRIRGDLTTNIESSRNLGTPQHGSYPYPSLNASTSVHAAREQDTTVLTARPEARETSREHQNMTSQMQAGPSQMQAGPSQMQGGPSQMQGGPSQMQGGPSQMQGGPSHMNVAHGGAHPFGAYSNDAVYPSSTFAHASSTPYPGTMPLPPIFPQNMQPNQFNALLAAFIHQQQGFGTGSSNAHATMFGNPAVYSGATYPSASGSSDYTNTTQRGDAAGGTSRSGHEPANHFNSGPSS